MLCFTLTGKKELKHKGLKAQKTVTYTQKSQNTLRLTHTTMECTWPKSLPSSNKKAIEKLVQGRDIANQLRSLLNKSVGDDDDNNNNAAPTEEILF